MVMKTPTTPSQRDVILETALPGIPLFKKGKVREVYDLGETLLIVASDRISAFDVVLGNGIPWKGKVLTALSCFWFDLTKEIVPNHLLSSRNSDFPKQLQPHAAVLRGRSLWVKKTQPLPVECVVRGYLAGSGWKEYQQSQSVCAVPLPKGLKESSQLPEPIFTPSTKADGGHDENISEKQMKKIIGEETGEKVKQLSLEIYKKAAAFAQKRGILIADTKFEFGLKGGELILIDEILTPDSSRFWPEASYREGTSPASFDKQFVRDYLESIRWNKKPPAPALPEEVILKTQEKYLEAYRRLTGHSLEKETAA